MLPCTGEEKLIVQAVESLSPCFQMLVVQSAPRDAFHKIQSLSEQHLHCCLENVIKMITSTHLSLKSYQLEFKNNNNNHPTDGAQLKGQGWVSLPMCRRGYMQMYWVRRFFYQKGRLTPLRKGEIFVPTKENNCLEKYIWLLLREVNVRSSYPTLKEFHGAPTQKCLKSVTMNIDLLCGGTGSHQDNIRVLNVSWAFACFYIVFLCMIKKYEW